MADRNVAGEYIQASFGQLQKIQAVATQRKEDTSARVKTYKFAYSSDGATYEYVKSADGSDRVFVPPSDT